MIQSNSLFVDTSGWVSLILQSELQHDMAAALYHDALQAGRPIVTTSYIISELIPLLQSRLKHAHVARPQILSLVSAIIDNPEYRILHIDAPVFMSAWKMLQQYRDKEWSLVDTISIVVMRTQRMTEALATDHHFAEAGLLPLLPHPHE
jgi:predicted nucleic acid-binding protein